MVSNSGFIVLLVKPALLALYPLRAAIHLPRRRLDDYWIECVALYRFHILMSVVCLQLAGLPYPGLSPLLHTPGLAGSAAAASQLPGAGLHGAFTPKVQPVRISLLLTLHASSLLVLCR